MFQIEYEVEEADIEPRYKHVHHAHSLCLLELCRLRLLDSVGYPNSSLLEQGINLVIVRIEAQYKREVKTGKVTIVCDEAHLEEKSFFVMQKILNQKGKVAVEARIEFKCMSSASKRAMEPPQAFIEAFLSGVENG
ncbi:thioesterase family protein [Oligoflexia bacterium]|nr:thioesterase family protein [Oligoflexia bacterium]